VTSESDRVSKGIEGLLERSSEWGPAPGW
jgi:hypothetical protein